MQQPRKPSPLEETTTQFINMTQINFESVRKNWEIMSKNREVSIKNLETKIGKLSRQLSLQSGGGFNGSTLTKPKSESYKDIELRNRVVPNKDMESG